MTGLELTTQPRIALKCWDDQCEQPHPTDELPGFSESFQSESSTSEILQLRKALRQKKTESSRNVSDSPTGQEVLQPEFSHEDLNSDLPLHPHTSRGR